MVGDLEQIQTQNTDWESQNCHEYETNLCTTLRQHGKVFLKSVETSLRHTHALLKLSFWDPNQYPGCILTDNVPKSSWILILWQFLRQNTLILRLQDFQLSEGFRTWSRVPRALPYHKNIPQNDRVMKMEAWELVDGVFSSNRYRSCNTLLVVNN